MASELTRETGVALPASDSYEWDWENMEHGESAVVPARFESEAGRFVLGKPGWAVVTERVQGEDEDGSNVRIWFIDCAAEDEGRSDAQHSEAAVIGAVLGTIPVQEQGA